MGYFAKLREKESRFYQRMWQELSDVKIIDTHEHIAPTKNLIPDYNLNMEDRNPMKIPDLYTCSYVKGLSNKGDYKSWAQELKGFRGTGYLRAWYIAMEDLYGLEGPITPKYLEKMEKVMNDAYRNDMEKGTDNHLVEVLNKMNVERVIVNIGLDAHLEMPRPLIQAAAGIPGILQGLMVPSERTNSQLPVYWYAKEKLGRNYADIRTLDDYCDVTEKMLAYFRDSGDYLCYKMQMAYNRPLWFPEPDEDESKYHKMFNKIPKTEQDAWLWGDYMFHFVLEWTAFEWKVPFQIHTGLARMYDGGSNALNMSHLFLKFPDIHFDLFHGNYPYYNLPGMLHQIPNISADLCWLPAISPTAAKQTLTELLEVGDMVEQAEVHQPGLRTSLFGGDSRLVEGSYGALQIAKDVLIRSLEDLKNRGHIFEMDAIDLAEQVLYHNPKRIFNL